MRWNELIGVILGGASGVIALLIVSADLCGFISFEIAFKGMIGSLVIMGIGICFLPHPFMWYKR